VTIVAPRARVDLALPSNVSLASLLPTLLQYAGTDLADDGAAHGGWALSRLGGQLLDTGRTAAQLQVRDGELLYLTPRTQTAPELVFDDVIDAVATATQNRTDRWTLAATRRFATIFACLALLCGVLVVVFAGPPQLPGAAIGFAVGALLLVAAGVLTRLGDGRTVGILLGLLSLGYAGAGGLLLAAGDRGVDGLGAPHVLIAATAVIVYAAASTLAMRSAAPVFVGATVAGAALGVGAAVSLVFGASAAASAAVVAAVTFMVIPALPMAAFRMARLPVPSVPTGPADLKADRESVDGNRILALSGRADAYLTGFVTTVAVIETGAEVVAGFGGGVAGLALCGVLALVLMLRARPFSGRAQRVPLLAAGTVGLGVVALAGFVTASPLLRLAAVLGGLIVAALAAVVFGFAVAGKRVSPVWARLLDAGEVILILGILPLALWVCGLYGWIRTIKS